VVWEGPDQRWSAPIPIERNTAARRSAPAPASDRQLNSRHTNALIARTADGRFYSIERNCVSHTEQQLDPGLQGVSVALMDRKGACRGAVGTTVPMSAYRGSAEMLEAMLPLLRDVAQALRPLL
jgi:DNA-binding IclR family transcriptional regulator